jgi:hypothetical protein
MAEQTRPVPNKEIIERYCGLGNMKVPLEHVLAYADSIYRGLSELLSLKDVYPLINFDQLLITAHRLNKARLNPRKPQNFSLIHERDEVAAYLGRLIDGYSGGLLSNSNYALATMPLEHRPLNPFPLEGLEERLKQLRPETTTQLLKELNAEPKTYCHTQDARLALIDSMRLTEPEAIGKIVYLDFMGALSPNAGFSTKTKAFAKAIHQIVKEYSKVYTSVEEHYHRPQKIRLDIEG